MKISIRVGGVINVDDYSNVRVDVEIEDDVHPEETLEEAAERVRKFASIEVGQTLIQILAHEGEDSRAIRKMRQHPLVKMAASQLTAALQAGDDDK